MAIRINGMASGLPANLVDQVIDAERIPIRTMENKKAKIEDKVKLVTEFETKINDIGKNMSAVVGTKGFVDKKFNSGFPDILSGTLDPEVADPGEWSIEVVQLATKPAVVTAGYPDKNETTMGTGYMVFDTMDGEKEVYIDEENSTLEKIAQTINSSNIGIRAVVVNDRNDKEDSYRLEIAGLKTGDDNQVKFPTVYFLDGQSDFEFVKTNPAMNAIYKLDGHQFESATNVITDLIPGVTLDLKRAVPGQPIRVNISENYDVIADKVKSFVDSYNEALAFIQKQNTLTPDKDGNQRLGPLGGDSMIRMTQGRLRALVQDMQDTNSKFKRIIELGVEFNRNGTLNFNKEKFTKIVNAEPLEVVEFLKGDLIENGFIPSMKKKLAAITDSQTGSVTIRKKSMQNEVSQIDKRIDTKERYLVKREEQIRRKFAKMEEAMSNIQAQGSSTQAALAGVGGGK